MNILISSGIVKDSATNPMQMQRRKKEKGNQDQLQALQ